MAYVPTSEYQGEIDELIDKIVKTLITQEEYRLHVSGFAEGKGFEFERREPNFEALNHVHPLLVVHDSSGLDGWIVQFNTKFIGKINYWKECREHYITKQHSMDTESVVLTLNTVISISNFLNQIVEQTVEQIHRLEKVLFCFET
jgi:hypothetical protein